MYKYLLWDIDGTILNFLASEKYAIRTLFEKYNIGDCSDEMIEMYSEINKDYWQRLERGEMTKQEILVGRFVEFFDKIGADASLAEAFNSDYQIVLGDHIEFMDGAKEILDSQKGKYILAAVTNGTKVAQTKKLKLSGFDRIFDAIFISEDVGCEKPDKEYFNFVFNKLGISDKSDALIIGDSLTSDMMGGYISGIDTCWFNPFKLSNTLNIPVTYEIDSIIKLKEILD